MTLSAKNGTLTVVGGNSPQLTTDTTGFVYREGAQLMLDGEPYRFIGPNCLDLIGNWSGTGFTAEVIDAYFALWPANTAHRIKPLEENSQIWDSYETPYEQLTIVVQKAEKYQQKLITTLMDGIDFSQTNFYLDRAWFQGGWENDLAAHPWMGPDYGTHTTNFKNWITLVCGVFKNSPAIAAWEIINEPDNANPVTGVTQAEMKAFFAAVAAHIKSVDPNHLVTTGIMGPNQLWNNTIAKYADLHDTADIDMVTVHEYQYAFNGGWIGSDLVDLAVQAAALIGKPCFVGESGVGPGSGGSPVTAAQRASVFQQKLDIFFGIVKDNSHTPHAYDYPVCGVQYFQLLATPPANAGTCSSPEYFNNDPMTSPNAVIDMLLAYDMWATPEASGNQLEDDFAAKNTNKWTWENANATVSGGQLLLTPQTSIYSNGSISLDGELARVEMVSPCAVGNGTTQCGLKIVTGDWTENLQIYWANGLLHFTEHTTTDDDTSITYNATNHRWLQIREDNGTVYWETSPTGADGSWTVRRSKTWAITQITNMVATVFAGYYGTEPTPGTATFDNVLVATGTASPPPNQLEDDFATKDTNKWTWENANASVVSGQLNLTPKTSIISNDPISLDETLVRVEMVSPCNVGNGSTQCGLKIPTGDWSQNFKLYWANGNLYMGEHVSSDDETNIAYNSTDHRWLQIREAGGTVYWETSPTGADGSWTVRRSKAYAIAQVTNMVAQIFGDYWGTEPTPGTAIFDNLLVI